MINEQILMDYETPKVDVIEVEVEKGFATSPGDYPYDDGWNN